MAEKRGTVGGPVLTEWFATEDLHKLDVYESLGGYSALRKVVKELTATQVIPACGAAEGQTSPQPPNGPSYPRTTPAPNTSSSTPTSRSPAAPRTAT